MQVIIREIRGIIRYENLTKTVALKSLQLH